MSELQKKLARRRSLNGEDPSAILPSFKLSEGDKIVENIDIDVDTVKSTATVVPSFLKVGTNLRSPTNNTRTAMNTTNIQSSIPEIRVEESASIPSISAPDQISTLPPSNILAPVAENPLSADINISVDEKSLNSPMTVVKSSTPASNIANTSCETGSLPPAASANDKTSELPSPTSQALIEEMHSVMPPTSSHILVNSNSKPTEVLPPAAAIYSSSPAVTADTHPTPEIVLTAVAATSTNSIPPENRVSSSPQAPNTERVDRPFALSSTSTDAVAADVEHADDSAQIDIVAVGITPTAAAAAAAAAVVVVTVDLSVAKQAEPESRPEPLAASSVDHIPVDFVVSNQVDPGTRPEPAPSSSYSENSSEINADKILDKQNVEVNANATERNGGSSASKLFANNFLTEQELKEVTTQRQEQDEEKEEELEVNEELKSSNSVPAIANNRTREFRFVSSFDTNGLFFYLGSKNGSYSNPHMSGAVLSSMKSIHRGHDAFLVQHGCESLPNYTKNMNRSWVKVDIGEKLRFIPNYYSFRHGGSSAGNSIRTWSFQARSVDSEKWITLRAHANDTSLGEQPGSAASWPVVVSARVENNFSGYRFFRVVQQGRNSGGNNCLFCGGLELYGTLTQSD